MKKIYSEIFRVIILSLILSLFSISFMEKRYDPSNILLNKIYNSEDNVEGKKLSFSIKDERSKDNCEINYHFRKSEFSSDFTTFDTYKYIMDISEDNFTPYRFSTYSHNRRLLKIDEKVELVSGYMPYSINTYITSAEYGNNYFASVLLYEDQVTVDLLENGSYEDLLFQEVIKNTNSVRIGYYNSYNSDYKIAGIVKGNAPDKFEILSSLLPIDMSDIKSTDEVKKNQVILMNGFTYYLTGIYEKDIKVIRLLFEENPLGDVKFTLNNPSYDYINCLGNNEKYKNNNLYIYGIILLSIYLLYNFQANIKSIKQDLNKGIINKETNLKTILKNTYIHSLIYLLSSVMISILVCLIYYLVNKDSLIYFSINPIITCVIPIGLWLLYAPMNVIIFNEVINS